MAGCLCNQVWFKIKICIELPCAGVVGGIKSALIKFSIKRNYFVGKNREISWDMRDN